MSLRRMMLALIVLCTAVLPSFAATVQLKVGWNLVPVPVASGTSVQTWLSNTGLQGLTKIWTYDGSWLQYVPGEDNTASGRFNTFTTNRGYWFLMSQAGTYTFTQSLTPLQLTKTGWTLAGFGNESALTFEGQVLNASTIDSAHGPENITKVWGFDGNAWKYYAAGDSSSTTSTMNPGQAHWFLVANANGKEVSEASPMTITPVGATGSAALIIGGATQLTPPSGAQASSRLRFAFQTVQSAATSGTVTDKCLNEGDIIGYARAFSVAGVQLSSDSLSLVKCRFVNGQIQPVSYEVGFDSATKAYLATNPDIANNLVIKVELNTGQAMKSIVADKFVGVDMNSTSNIPGSTVDAASTLGVALAGQELAKKAGVPADRLNLGEADSGVSAGVDLNSKVKQKDVVLGSFSSMLSRVSTGTSPFTSLIARIEEINAAANVTSTSTNSAANQVLDALSGKDSAVSTSMLDNAKKVASSGMELLASRARSAGNALISTQSSKLDQLAEQLLMSGDSNPALMNTADIISRSMAMAQATSGDKLIGTVASKNLSDALANLDPIGLASADGETMALAIASAAVAFPDSLVSKLAQNKEAAGNFAGIVGQSNSLLKAIESRDKNRGTKVLANSQAAASKLTGAQSLFAAMAKQAPDNDTLNAIMAEAISASAAETGASKEIFSKISEIKTSVETGSLKVDFASIANVARSNAADLKSVALAIAKNSGGASDAAKVLKEMNSILPPADLQLILDDEQISGDFGLGSSLFADAGPDLFAKIRNGGASFKLDGTASFDPRGASLSYFWSEVNTDGSTSAVATDAATSVQPTFTVTGIASNRVRKTYRLTVRDANTGRKSEDDVFVLLEAARPPVVLVPRFLSVPQNETFVIDALDSFDPEGFDPELTFALSANGSATNQQVTTGIFELSYSSKGRQDLLLTVTADTADGGTAVSTAAITVRVEGSLPPIADAGYDLIVSSDEVREGFVELPNFSFSPTGQEPLTFEWSPGNLFSSQSGRNHQSRHPLFTTTAPGAYTVTLKVTDTQGNQSTDSIVVVVKRGLPPVADAGLPIVIRGSGQKSFTLDGSFSFSFTPGGLTAWAWSGPAGQIATGTGTPTTSVNINLDDYSQKTKLTYQLKVSDANGSSSAEVEVFLVPEQNGLTPPIVIVDRFPQKEVFNPGERILLNAGASFSPDFAPVNFSWTVQSNSIQSQVRGQQGEILDLQIPSNFTGTQVPVVLEVANSQSSNVESRREISLKVVSLTQPPIAILSPKPADGLIVEYGTNVTDSIFVDCFDSFTLNEGSNVRCSWQVGPGLQPVGATTGTPTLEFKVAGNITDDRESYVDLTVVDSLNPTLSSTDRVRVLLRKRFANNETRPLFLDSKPELNFVRDRDFPIYRPLNNELVYADFGANEALSRTLKMFGYVENPNITDNSVAATVTATLYELATGSKGVVLHTFAVTNLLSGGQFLDFELDSVDLSTMSTRALLEIQAQSGNQSRLLTYAVRLNTATGNQGQVSASLEAKPLIVFADRTLNTPTDYFSGNFAYPYIHAEVDGSGSVNTNGGPVEYRWQWRWADNQPTVPAVPLFGFGTSMISLDIALPTTAARTLEVGLQVADPVSGSVSATKWVTFKDIRFSNDVPPIADPGFVPQPLFLAADQNSIQVPLDASLSFSPSGKALKSVTWTHEFGFPVFGTNAMASSTSTTVAFANVGKGRHRFKLVVTDVNNKKGEAFLEFEVIQEEVVDPTAEFFVEGFADAYPRDGFVNEPSMIDTDFFVGFGAGATANTVADDNRLIRRISFPGMSAVTYAGSGFFSAQVSSSVTGFAKTTVEAFYDVNGNGVFDGGEPKKFIEIPMTFRKNTVSNLFAGVEAKEPYFLPEGSQQANLPVTFFVNTTPEELQSKGAYLEFSYDLQPFEGNSMPIFGSVTSASGFAPTLLMDVASGSYALNLFVFPRDISTDEYLSDEPIAQAFRDIRVFGNEANVIVRVLDPRGKLLDANSTATNLMASIIDTSAAGVEVASSYVNFLGFGDAEFMPMSVGGNILTHPLELRVTRFDMSMQPVKVETLALQGLKLGQNFVELNLAQVTDLVVDTEFIVDDSMLPLMGTSYTLTFSQRITGTSTMALRPLSMTYMGSVAPAVFSTAPRSFTTPNRLNFTLAYGGPGGLQKEAGVFEIQLVATLKGLDENGAMIERERHITFPANNEFLFWSPIDFSKLRPTLALSPEMLIGQKFNWRQSGFSYGAIKFETGTASVVDYGYTRNFDWEIRQGRLYMKEVYEGGSSHPDKQEFSAFEINPEVIAGSVRYVFENGQASEFAEPFAFEVIRPFRVNRALSITDAMPTQDNMGVQVRFSSAIPSGMVTQIHPLNLPAFLGVPAGEPLTFPMNASMQPNIEHIRAGGYLIFRNLDAKAIFEMTERLGRVYETGGAGFVDIEPGRLEHRQMFANNLMGFLSVVGVESIVPMTDSLQISCSEQAMIPGAEACRTVELGGAFPNGYGMDNYMIYFLPVLETPQLEDDMSVKLVLRNSAMGFYPGRMDLPRSEFLMNAGMIRMSEGLDSVYFEEGGLPLGGGHRYTTMKFGSEVPQNAASMIPEQASLVNGVRVGNLSQDQGVELGTLAPAIQYLEETRFNEYKRVESEIIVFARHQNSGSILELASLEQEMGMPKLRRGTYSMAPGSQEVPIAWPILVDKGLYTGAANFDAMLKIGQSVMTSFIETEEMNDTNEPNAPVRYNREDVIMTSLAYIPELTFHRRGYNSSTMMTEVMTSITLRDLVMVREEAFMYPVEFMSATGGEANGRWVRSQQPNAWPGSRETNYILLARGIGPVVMMNMDLDARYDQNLETFVAERSMDTSLMTAFEVAGEPGSGPVTSFEAGLLHQTMISEGYLIQTTFGTVERDAYGSWVSEFTFTTTSANAGILKVTDFRMNNGILERDANTQEPVVQEEMTLNWHLTPEGDVVVEDEGEVLTIRPVMNRGLPGSRGSFVLLVGPAPGILESEIEFFVAGPEDEGKAHGAAEAAARAFERNYDFAWNYSRVSSNAFVRNNLINNEIRSGFSFRPMPSHSSMESGVRAIVRGPGLPSEGLVFERDPMNSNNQEMRLSGMYQGDPAACDYNSWCPDPQMLARFPQGEPLIFDVVFEDHGDVIARWTIPMMERPVDVANLTQDDFPRLQEATTGSFTIGTGGNLAANAQLTVVLPANRTNFEQAGVHYYFDAYTQDSNYPQNSQQRMHVSPENLGVTLNSYILNNPDVYTQVHGSISVFMNDEDIPYYETVYPVSGTMNNTGTVNP